MTITRLSKATCSLLAVATILGTASLLASRSRALPRAANEPLLASQSESLSPALLLSPGIKSLALHAVAKYDAVKPFRASDHFHRWRFLSLNSSYPLNTKLRFEVAQMQNQRNFGRTFPGSPPLFFRSPYGWEVRQRTATSARDHWEYEHHVDQFLATSAEIGAPLSLSIETDFGRVSVGELLEASRRGYDSSQESYWTLVAYCSYLPEEPQWQNRFGELCSYELMIEAILLLPLDSGSCGGTHKQFALAYFLRSPSSARVNANLRRRCEEYLEHSSRLLERSQLSSGAWTPTWATSPQELSHAAGPPSMSGADLVRITGHQLEWIDIAPTADRPSSACIARALRFLAESLSQAGAANIQKEYCAYSHAACVLRRTLLSESDPSARRSISAPDKQHDDDLASFPTRREGSSSQAQTP
jgi:hypothetical protein